MKAIDVALHPDDNSFAASDEDGRSSMRPLQLSNQVVQKSPYWRANDALGHVEQKKFKFCGFL